MNLLGGLNLLLKGSNEMERSMAAVRFKCAVHMLESVIVR